MQLEIRIVVILMLIINISLFGQKKIAQSFLNLEGYVEDRNLGESIKDAKIEVFDINSVIVQALYTNDSGFYQISIPLHTNRKFKIKVSYPNFIHKYFEIDTKGVPNNFVNNKIRASINLWKVDNHINYDFFELPLIRFSYNSYKNKIEYDRSYIEATSKAMEIIYQVEEKVKKQNELLLEQKENEIKLSNEKRQKKFLFIIISAILIIALGSIFAFLRQKKLRKLVDKKNIQIEEQKHLVEEKQKEIVDSITYAKRLQQAILPPAEFIYQNVPDSFILYKPKDIVAGDFYWAEKVGEKFFIAAADSTGHGVPGAMVSVVCSNALNRTIKEFDLTDTGKILDKTRELVIETFEKSNEDVKDGMDISLLCINSKNKEIFWSGANNPLWYIQNKALKEIKADKQPIGKTDNPKPFITHQIEYIENTMFYLFTDGLADQFGGSNGKKFKYKQFEDILITINHKSMKEQLEVILQKFDNWKGSLEQVDDVCVIGIKI